MCPRSYLSISVVSSLSLIASFILQYHYPEDLPKVIVITLDDDTILHIHRGLHPGDDPYLCRPTEPTHVAFVRIKMLTVSGIRCKHLELFNMWLRKANQLEEIVIEGTGGGEYHYFLDIADGTCYTQRVRLYANVNQYYNQCLIHFFVI